MGMEEAKESVRLVVGKQKNPIVVAPEVPIVSLEHVYLLKLETWLTNPESTEGVGL